MLTVPRQVKIFVALQPTDMRRGFPGGVYLSSRRSRKLSSTTLRSCTGTDCRTARKSYRFSPTITAEDPY